MATIFMERLVNLDFTYFDVKRGLVGETLLVECTLTGPQNTEGMVLDFGHLKPRVAHALEQSIDHQLVIPRYATDHQGPCVHITPCPQQVGNTRLRLGNTEDALLLSMPDAGFTLIETEIITLERLEHHLKATILNTHWWDNRWRLQLRLFPEPMASDTPFFHYTHGLAKHKGACQRIAHGHRSRLQISVNGQPHAALTAFWRQQWQDIYLGNALDQAPDSQDARYHFAYRSPEGHYALSIPAKRVYLLDRETTIENIAQHVADASARLITQGQMREVTDVTVEEGSALTIEARVYEGVYKGAIATASPMNVSYS